MEPLIEGDPIERTVFHRPLMTILRAEIGIYSRNTRDLG